MADFDNLVKSFAVGDQLDEIASADPPAYLRRCFAQGSASPALGWRRIQQLAVCAMVLAALVNARDYELIADCRTHFVAACRKLTELARQAFQRVMEQGKPDNAQALAELQVLNKRLAGS